MPTTILKQKCTDWLTQHFGQIQNNLLPHRKNGTQMGSVFWRYRPDLNWGIKVLQTFALPLGHGTIFGAGDEARTRYLHLGKVALYRMSYTRILVPKTEPWCLRSESNQRHADFQSAALPTELQRHVVQSKCSAQMHLKWRPGTDSNRRPPA